MVSQGGYVDRRTSRYVNAAYAKFSWKLNQLSDIISGDLILSFVTTWAYSPLLAKFMLSALQQRPCVQRLEKNLKNFRTVIWWRYRRRARPI